MVSVLRNMVNNFYLISLLDRHALVTFSVNVFNLKKSHFRCALLCGKIKCYTEVTAVTMAAEIMHRKY